jgi:hypothetical protein
MTELELMRTIGGAMVSSLPVFAVFAVNQRITKEFNKGWHNTKNEVQEHQVTKKFRCSLLWSVPFSMLTLGLISLFFYYINQNNHLRFIAYLAIPITLFSLVGTIYIFSLSIEVLESKIVFKNMFRKSEVSFASIRDIRCLAGYLVVTDFNEKVIKTPLFYNDLTSLGYTLKKHCYEIIS